MKNNIMTLKDELIEIETRVNKAADGWTGSSNYPFYTDLKRPRQSLGKHDSDKYDDIRFLHVDDAALIVTAKRDILFLLDHMKELEKELHSYKFNKKMDEVLNEEKD